MWALTRDRGPSLARHDSGAVLVIVAILMVAFLGISALVIDFGSIYVERRELQNGADAAALAVAMDCAGANDCDADTSTPRARDLAIKYAGLNAGKDGLSNVDLPTPCGLGQHLGSCPQPQSAARAMNDGATGWVLVQTSTKTANGTTIDYRFIPGGKKVTARAVAAWGPPGAATTIPLILSACEYLDAGGIVPSEGGTATLPNLPSTIYFHTSTQAVPCPATPSGGDAPGGFGWLATSLGCAATIDAGKWIPASTGVPPPATCNPIEWRNKDIVLAIFDRTNGATGANLEYHVLGFAAFHLTGYSFNPGFWSADPSIRNPHGLCPAAPGSSGVCITGRFVAFSDTAGSFGGTDLGVRVIKMVG